MADGQQGQSGQQQFNANDYYLKQQAVRMLSAIQKGYNDNFQTAQVSMPNSQTGQQVSVYMNHQVGNSPLSQQQQQQHQQTQQQQQQQGHQQQQPTTSSHNVQHQQLQHQLQQVQQAQQQFQQMQQLAQMQQQFQQQYNTGGGSTSSNSSNLSISGGSSLTHDTSTFSPSRRGRKPTDKRKRKRHTFVKRPTTAYLYFVSKYRETLKEAGEVVPKAKIITQACAEKWRHMTEDEKEPFLELARRDRERWQQDKSLEKRPRDPNRPKRPPSAYFLFLADFRKSYPNKTDPAKEITKKAGEQWNGLSDMEKTPYYRNAQVERAKWELDLEAYKQSQKGNTSMNRGLTINPNQHVGSSSDVSSPSPGTNVTSMPNLMAGQANLMGGTISSVPAAESPSPVNAGLGQSMQQQQQQSPQGSSQTVYAYPTHHMLGGTQASNLQFHTAR
uniref:high mobility group protein DSP1-like isoform X2 n=1 Tax=Styela clava TaxID=7725 RepID=UPI001939357B|nr:high mobility group protein DSP1-like isoform X2 [Styela clava]